MARESNDEKYMSRALRLARKGIGYTSPNPAVGCVIVKDGQIIAQDYHRQAGQPHAEALALRRAGENARGADLYVTLEPCCIYGKTPPCTDALIGAGIKRIVIGTLDPNPRVNGRGAEVLHKAAIKVKIGVLESECRDINQGYNKMVSSGLPLVTIKYAQSLDGRIATKSGMSRWISSEQSRRFAHRLRAGHDAILVGASTANSDNPQLTVRHVKGHNPIRIILSRRGKIPADLKMLKENDAPTIIATAKENEPELKRKLGGKADIIAVPHRENSLNLRALLKKLAKRGVNSVLIEGGSRTITGFLKENLADRAVIIIAPIILGDGINAVGDLAINKITRAKKLINIEYKKIGNDWVLSGDLF